MLPKLCIPQNYRSKLQKISILCLPSKHMFIAEKCLRIKCCFCTMTLFITTKGQKTGILAEKHQEQSKKGLLTA